MKACIKAISYYLPEKTITNQQLCEIFPDLDVEEIFKKSGVRTRHIVAPGEIASDLAYSSAVKFFEEHDYKPSDIDFLIFCTEAFDYIGPSSACILQDRLGLSKNIGALDIGYGCSGFVYGLSLAKGLIESSQATNVLLLTAEIPSTVIHPDDAQLRMIFGDGGAATLICENREDHISEIGNFVFGTDGAGAENLIIKSSGFREPMTEEWLEKYKEIGGLKFGRMEMTAQRIFIFALEVVPPMIEEILKKSGLKQNDIDLFVFHQPNGYLLDVLRKKLNIPESKYVIHMEECGNTVSATIPIALKEAINAGRAQKGDRILFAGFGIGYSWAATVVTL